MEDPEPLGQLLGPAEVTGAKRARGPGEVQVTDRAELLAGGGPHEPDRAAARPGQVSRRSVPGDDFTVEYLLVEQHRPRQVGDVMLDQRERRRRGRGLQPGRGGGCGPGPDCCATWMTIPCAVLGCRNASFHWAFARSTPTG